MSLADAQARLATRPRLRALIRDLWLEDQSSRPSNEFHRLYALLEMAGAPGVDLFLDGLERTLSAPIGGPVQRVAERLTTGNDGPLWQGFWSAVDELSVATRLTDCGLTARFGAPNPDVVASHDSVTLGIELTAPHRTRELEALQEEFAAEWSGSETVRILVGRETFRPIRRDRRKIIERAVRLSADRPADKVDVPITDIVPANVLRVELDPNLHIGIVSQTTDFLGHASPVPDIEAAIDKKRAQLRSQTAVVVAVNVDALGSDIHLWALRLIAGGSGALPTVRVASNVVGVVAFLRYLPGHPPLMAFWLRNEEWSSAEPGLLAEVLACLRVLH